MENNLLTVETDSTKAKVSPRGGPVPSALLRPRLGDSVEGGKKEEKETEILQESKSEKVEEKMVENGDEKKGGKKKRSEKFDEKGFQLEKVEEKKLETKKVAMMGENVEEKKAEKLENMHEKNLEKVEEKMAETKKLEKVEEKKSRESGGSSG